MLPNHLILCHSLLLLPSIFPSISLFPSESAFCIRRPSIGASASVLPMNIRGWLPLGLAALISLLSKGVFSSTIVWKHQFFSTLPSLSSSSHKYVTTGKTIALTIRTFVGRVMSLLFNTLSRFVIAFLQRSNHLLISWLQSLSAVILEPKKRKSVTTSAFSLSICHAVMGPDAIILVFWMLSFKPTF